ncbi:MAG: UDP-N-acetylmuramoyl-L-alanyl-D-glutamate--2,6-diaminopimelate ligase [bacterium]|nr:UDP-N-acetylmuramoyl-L-alanyl-D-glutamate--2,6-diaminopimelate ligase [bacterium]
MRLRNLIDEISYLDLVNLEELDDEEVEGITYNSKKVQPGDIFICITGEHIDGHECAEEALDNGAIACVVERRLSIEAPQIVVESTEESIAEIASVFYTNPSRKLNVIGVTGTNGKTTVTHLIQKLYEAFNQKCALIGTLGHKFSSEDSYHDAKHTTPQAPELQKLLYNINEKCIDNVVMEVSSHSLVQNRVAHVDFNGAVLTNLTQDHLDFHITMENYFKAKAMLFSQLVSGDFAVINNDDTYAERFLEVISRSVSKYTYGIATNSDVMAKDIVFGSEGASFTCVVNGKEYKTNLAMNGMFSVYNVLAAITTALALGFDIEKSIQVLEGISGVAGRFEVIVNKPTVIVDYAHTPDGLENVLKAAREITPKGGHLICIFGCGGDRDATKRPKMGAIAEKLADKVIVTSDNPRSENPQQIITDILAGFKKVNNVIVEADRELAIKEAYKIANANDIVLVAGKGHEDYQILGNETIHFDDREKVREIFIGE